MTYVIVGGVAGGASAAARMRRLDEFAEIIVLERGNYVSFANCGLPYHIGGVISERENLLVQTREELSRTFNLDIRVRNEVVSLDPGKKQVVVRKLDSGDEYTQSYDKLLLSPGAEPLRPPIPGIDSKRILTLRSMEDMDRIIHALSEYQVSRAVVVGAGFIGLEIAENLKRQGISVSIVEKVNQVLTPVDFDIAAQVHQHIAEYNIGLYLNNGVKEFKDRGEHLTVSLEDGSSIHADLVILSIGVRPETSLARDGGLAVGKTGGIKVNEYLQTSDESIYAVGDAVEVTHLVHGKEALVPLAWPANRQGRIVADTMTGKRKRSYAGSLGTSILQVFDLTVASTGLNEKTLTSFGIPYEAVTVNRKNHAGYYPKAVPMTLKVLFGREGEIYGAQGIGYDGVDKRIDIIAAAMKGSMKVWDLQDMEVAYAPPYNSAKDPVNIAGYAAENILEGNVKSLRYFEVDDFLKKDHTVPLDVRTPEEHLIGAIPGSVNINIDELRNRLVELDKSKTYLIYCQVGHRGYLAYRILAQNGFNAVNLDGGYALWHPTTLPQNNEEQLDYRAPEASVSADDDGKRVIEIDSCGLQCPGPILKTSKALADADEGSVIRVTATDPGFKKDVQVWADKTGNHIISSVQENGILQVTIRKGHPHVKHAESSGGIEKSRQTLVVFSGDMDKVLASLIIANGAIAMGKQVSMFFTFWGLNVLRKAHKVRVKKNFVEKMFAVMMPRGAEKLTLSNMHLAGMGTGMMKRVMSRKRINTVEELLSSYMENGGKIIACTMSMDVMGIKEEEIIPGVEFGGVASYLGDAQDSYSNLFI